MILRKLLDIEVHIYLKLSYAIYKVEKGLQKIIENPTFGFSLAEQSAESTADTLMKPVKIWKR